MYRIPTFATTNIQYTTYHVVVIILIRPSCVEEPIVFERIINLHLHYITVMDGWILPLCVCVVSLLPCVADRCMLYIVCKVERFVTLS